MERWANKVVVVTGASSGIGAGIAVELTKAGMIVVGLARRSEMIEKLCDELPENLRKNLHAMKCDIANEEEIEAAFRTIDEKLGAVSVMVNNAGIAHEVKLLEKEGANGIRNTVDVNVLGLVFCTREAYLSMKKHNIDDGHIININSVLGHNVPYLMGKFQDNFNIYPATKFAVTALTESFRQDFTFNQTKIKITSISPGLVKTGATDNIPDLDKMPHLLPKDIADAVVYTLSTPPHVQVHEITIKPLGETI